MKYDKLHMNNRPTIIENLIFEIDKIEKDSNSKINDLHSKIKQEAKSLSYNEAYYLLHSVSFTNEEFCILMNEIRENII